MRKRRRNKENGINESWLLPYSDLLTLLVALFIVLFAMSDVDAQKYKELAQVFNQEFSAGGEGILDNNNNNNAPVEIPKVSNEEDEKPESDESLNESENTRELAHLQTLQQLINDYISGNELAEVLGTQLTDEGLLITLLNDVSFDSGSAVVKGKGIKIAKEVSQFLYTDPPHQIVVSGHADDQPMHNAEFASNWELSVSRALNFMVIILENKKLDPTRFSAKGFGEYKPIVPNINEKNRAKNRRVEVLILPNFKIITNNE